MTRTACVIPGFNPDATAITDLTKYLLRASEYVLVVDDASADPSYLATLSDLGARTRSHALNAGIARSLNEGLSYAIEVGADWLLTVDQDSRLPAGYLDALIEQTGPRVGVVGAEVIGDVSGDLTYPTRDVAGHLLTDEVFQTGSLWNVSALADVGGFDESLGIDAVDAEACLSLRERGLSVVLAPGTRLEHQYGAGHPVALFGRTVIATDHSPGRRESMVRNRIALFPREFRQSPVHAFRTLRRVGVNVLLAVSVEDDKWAKAKGAARGLLPRRSQ